ncbi:MAG: glycogen synthase [Ruminococcaceae bacterium]|jgi:glycogen/starch synthases, ADP-glucose type|nr:glycogen synthase [Oscillospiraceae bacterium]
MRIAMIASEGAPFIKTGGLGDVMQALPEALAKQPHNEIVLILPCYKRIKETYMDQLEFITNFEVNLGWRRQYVGVMKLRSRRKKLRIYFIDNEYYFGRDGVYGFADDGERFAFFCRGALAALAYLDFHPEVIQCNDWQTALIPILAKSEYGDHFGYSKTVFTIHNVEYQGWTDRWFFYDVLELPDWCLERLAVDDALNFMKGAIETADCVTTVSETYAKELLYPYYAHGMDEVLRNNRGKLHGIVNGIDTDVFSPQSDPALFCNYSVEDFSEGKAVNKQKIQERCGLPVRPDVPMLAMITRLVGHKGIDLLCYIMDRLMGMDVQLVVIGTGEKKFEQALLDAQARYPDKLSVNLCFDTAFASQLYAGADIYLMPSRSEPCGLSQIIAMHYGTIPVVNETGGLKDTVTAYNTDTFEGRGYTFQSYNADDFLAAIGRCLDLYIWSQDRWKDLIRRDMELDVSWRIPAERYMELFRSLMN